jgi:putative ABC transport system permease protein
MTFQFTLSIILSVCAIANLRQLNYLRYANLGFNKELMILVETPDSFDEEYLMRETFKEELLQVRTVAGVAFAPGSPGGHVPQMPVDLGGQKVPVDVLLVDHEYFDVMNIKVTEGRKFNPKTVKDFPAQRLRSGVGLPPGKAEVLVNESFVREFLTGTPIGQTYHRDDVRGKRVYEIVGVVKDFHVRSLHHKISPMMFLQTAPMNIANIKVYPSDFPTTIKNIETAWTKVYGARAFNFSFLDETFDRQYRSDEQLATVIILFTGIALILACLGLFALSSFMISRRTKEIGIRKSMGASIKAIYTMLSWNFLKWIVVSIILGCPIAWWLTDIWLRRFAYHATLSIDIFIIAALVAFLVALFTVTWQSLKAANANPIKSLRYE